MKISKALVLLTVLVSLFTAGCKKINYHDLTYDDMLWLVYKNNQVDRFENGNGSSVSFSVVIRSKSYYDSGKDKNEWTAAAFEQLFDTTAIFAEDSYGELFITKQNTGLLVTLTWPHFPIKAVPLTSMIPTFGNVNGINYTDLYIINATGLTDARKYINKIWYSKSRGVIQFTDVFGNTWNKQF